VQVPDVQVVSAEGIGGNGTLGSGSVDGVLAAGVVVLRSLGGTSDDESGRSGQNKKSHDRILFFLFLKAKRRTPQRLSDPLQKVERRLGKLFIADS
jgi:hypothetical protein